MTNLEMQRIIDYIITLEASAIEYAAKFGVSETFWLALSRKPSNAVLIKLTCRPKAPSVGCRVCATARCFPTLDR